MKRLFPISGRLLLLSAVALTSACVWNASPKPSAAAADVAADPEPAPPPAPIAQNPAPAQPAANRGTQIAALEAESTSLKRQVVSLELRLLEQEARAEELETRLADARRESVRAMAKSDELATRSQAAAAMAKAEAALEALTPLAPPHVAAEVKGLIEQSAAEHAEQNYGGALYLADQAERTAVAANGQFANAEQDSPGAGEQPFTLPLHLQTTGRANVREGPGTGFGVLFTLPAESRLLAYSATEQWLRIADDSGRRGWIHQSLIRGRL